MVVFRDPQPLENHPLSMAGSAAMGPHGRNDGWLQADFHEAIDCRFDQRHQIMGSAGGDTHRDALPRCHRIPGLKGSELPPDFRGDVDNPSLVKMLLNAIEVEGNSIVFNRGVPGY
jgi:hypothetical protein